MDQYGSNTELAQPFDFWCIFCGQKSKFGLMHCRLANKYNADEGLVHTCRHCHVEVFLGSMESLRVTGHRTAGKCYVDGYSLKKFQELAQCNINQLCLEEAHRTKARLYAEQSFRRTKRKRQEEEEEETVPMISVDINSSAADQ